MKNRLAALRQYQSAALAFFGTIAISALFATVAYQIQTRYTLEIFDSVANRQAEALRRSVTNDLDYIGFGANFYQSVDKEDWLHFRQFAQRTMSGSNGLIALQWMEKVTPEAIATFVEEKQAEYPSFDIYTVPKDQPRKYGYVLEDNAPIYVASDVYPPTIANLKLMGFYDSRLRFELILQDIQRTGKANLSDKVRLIQDGFRSNLERKGLLVYYPVFDFRRDELLGIVIGVLRSTVYFESLVDRTSTEMQTLVRVIDNGFDAEDDPILFQSPGWTDEKGLTVSKTIHLSNRDWTVEFKRLSTLSHGDHTVLVGISLGGLVIALLVAYIVYLQTCEKTRLSLKLAEKTKELQFLVERDSLTSLYNRRAFRQHLYQHIAQRRLFTLVGFDVDHFKQINDQYGHLAGDDVLKQIALRVSDELSKSDRFYRLGGDEFCITSLKTDPTELASWLERIRTAIESANLLKGDAHIRCTLSIGAAVVRPTDDLDTLYHRMDIHLYRSKRQGRNGVSIAPNG